MKNIQFVFSCKDKQDSFNFARKYIFVNTIRFYRYIFIFIFKLIRCHLISRKCWIHGTLWFRKLFKGHWYRFRSHVNNESIPTRLLTEITHGCCCWYLDSDGCKFKKKTKFSTFGVVYNLIILALVGKCI